MGGSKGEAGLGVPQSRTGREQHDASDELALARGSCLEPDHEGLTSEAVQASASGRTEGMILVAALLCTLARGSHSPESRVRPCISCLNRVQECAAVARTSTFAMTLA